MTTENTNGTYNGTWHRLTLPDSGATLEYRRVSHMLMRDASLSVKKPAPPLVEVKYGDNVKLEPNVNAPEYIGKLVEWRMKQNEISLETAIILGVKVDVDRERVNELRQKLVDRGIELPGDDLVVYVTRILCESTRDLETLRDAIIIKSQPTEVAIDKATETFQRDIQGN